MTNVAASKEKIKSVPHFHIIFVLIRRGQQFFSHVETISRLSGLNQYY